MAARISPKAFPLADADFQKRILEIIKQALHIKQVRIGASEVAKAVNRGLSEFVVLAADADPIEIVLHLPQICEEKQIPYVFVRSKMSIGRSCGLSRRVIACTVTMAEQSQLQAHIDTIKESIDDLIL